MSYVSDTERLMCDHDFLSQLLSLGTMGSVSARVLAMTKHTVWYIFYMSCPSHQGRNRLLLWGKGSVQYEGTLATLGRLLTKCSWSAGRFLS